MGRRVKLIFNPRADRGRAAAAASSLQSASERYRAADWIATERPGHAVELAEQAARDGFDVVVAFGGDGTVHEIVNGLMRVPPERRPLLAAVPIGSGNDFCANVGVILDAPTALQRVFSGEVRNLDLAHVTDDSGRSEYWANVLGIGFDATVSIYTNQMKRLQGFSMYLWATILTILRNHVAPRMTVTTDRETIDEEALMLTLCNGRREGGGFLVAPDARPDDGVLDYAMIQRVSRPMMFRLIPEVMKGTHGRFKQVRLGRFRTLRLHSSLPVTIHFDGEIFAGLTSKVQELDVRVQAGALRMIV
jgi:YegS/Rv2252/BmrU family lipid kinase